MGAQYTPILTLTLTAAEGLAAHRFVTVAGQKATGTAIALGVTGTSAGTGEVVDVIVEGTAVVEAGASISKGALVTGDSDGKATTASSGTYVYGIALEDANAGDLFEVLLVKTVVALA